MRIAIMGSGGVGAYVGGRLQAAGENVVFIALASLSGTTSLLRASMGQILAHPELRWLSGRLYMLGQHHAVPTPGHSVVFRGLVLHEHGKST